MNQSQPKIFLKSSGAVFAGILANFLIAVPIDAMLHAAHVFPPMTEKMSDSLCALALSYRLLAAIVGGYLTARFAPHSPMRHVFILGGIGIVLSSLGTVAGWDLGPHWYPISLIVISLPLSWVGAKLYLNSKA